MKFTLSWLKDHLETRRARRDRRSSTRSGSRSKASTIPRPSSARSPSRACSTPSRIRKPTSCSVAAGRDRARQADRRGRLRRAQLRATGLVGVFAPLGAYIPGTGITLEKKPVRGVVSNGMMLSEREMQLSDDHEGIVDLDAKLAEQRRPALCRRARLSAIPSSRSS